MQKGTYTIFVPLLILQAFTGFALLTMPIPGINMSPRELLVGWWLGAILGSVDMAGWWMRTAHYLMNWLFIVLTTIHVYLSVTEDFPAFMDFFGLSFLGPAHDEDDHQEHGAHQEGQHETLEPEVTPAVASPDPL